MKTLQLIMSHKEARETVLRHLPIWESINKDIMFTSPVNSMMEEIPKCKQLAIGMAEHHGELSAHRIKNIIYAALVITGWEYLLLMEYDSFAIALPEDVFPSPGGVSAATYSQNKPIKFRGKFYLHYPMMFTREGLEKTFQKLKTVTTKDRDYSDRFIGRAVEYAKIPVKNLLGNKRAYSKNTIEAKHYPALKEAVRNGAVFFHGVKTAEVLKIITER